MIDKPVLLKMAQNYDEERQPLLQAQKLGNGITAYNQQESTADTLDPPLPDEPTTWECLKVMLGFWVGTFLAALDSTLVATLTAAISDSFDSLSLLSWVATGYLIANAAIQPLSGKLTDIYGRRAGFMFAITFFTAGNVICALAQKEWVMILGRLVAGAGGGCLNTISTFVASDIIPLRRRGVWQGIANLNYGVSHGFFYSSIALMISRLVCLWEESLVDGSMISWDGDGLLLYRSHSRFFVLFRSGLP